MGYCAHISGNEAVSNPRKTSLWKLIQPDIENAVNLAYHNTVQSSKNGTKIIDKNILS
jgi:hypothetical protein